MDQQALHYAMKYALFQLRYMRVKLEVQLNHDLIKLNRNRKKPNISVAINQHLKDQNLVFMLGQKMSDFRRWRDLFFEVQEVEARKTNKLEEEEPHPEENLDSEEEQCFESINVNTVYSTKKNSRAVGAARLVSL